MNEMVMDRKWRSEKQKCLLWGFVPVFDFFAFLLMADNSGQDKYRRKGLAFAAISMTAFLLIVSGDLLIYFTTIGLGMMAAAYIRSLIIVAGITLLSSYVIQLILIALTRREYLTECAYMDKAFGTEEEIPEAVEEPKRNVKEAVTYDLNTCSREELQDLPGIDAAMALRILNDRYESGGYASVEEFIDRYRIKPHFAAKIMERAYVSSADDKADIMSAASAGKPSRAIDI